MLKLEQKSKKEEEEENKKMNKQNDKVILENLVKEWSIEKGLDKADSKIQLLKLFEEAGELASGLLKNNNEVIIDSLGDIQVVLIILHQQLGLDMNYTLNYAYDEIKNRTGKTVNGVFVKEQDL